MIITGASIIVGLLVARLAYTSWFSNSGDLADDIDGFLAHNRKIAPEDDDGWFPAGFRLLLLLLLSGFSGYLAYCGLHKLFG